MNGTDETAEMSDERHQALVNAHLAEYGAITTRNTYYMAVSLGLASFLTTSFGLVAQIPRLDSVLRVWLWVLGAELGCIVWYWCVYEQYTNVRYIEIRLRPKVQALLGTEAVWDYEAYKTGDRGREKGMGDVSVCALMCIAFIFLTILWWPGRLSFFWALDLFLLLVVIFLTIRTIMMTNAWSRDSKDIAAARQHGDGNTK